jgi:methyl-accepting chemotaxis protein
MEDMSSGARDQVDTVERTRTLAEEMAGASRASAASQAMRGLRATSGHATETIRELGQNSEEIGTIVDTIAGIAQQTNLLALNAAIEAARASFERIDAAIDEMAERVAQIAAAIDEVADGSDRVRSDIVTVAEVAERFSASTDQVSASTQQTTAATQEITASATELAQTADELESLVGAFRLP